MLCPFGAAAVRACPRTLPVVLLIGLCIGGYTPERQQRPEALAVGAGLTWSG